MTFVWIDRDGRRQELETPEPIEAEAAAISNEMDRYVDILESPDHTLRDKARVAIGRLQPRLERLHADLARWNEHAVAVTRSKAAELSKQIGRLPAMIDDMLLVVELHKEHDRIMTVTAGALEMRTRLLAEPMTALQRRAITACASRTPPPNTATREQAKAWLDTQPLFARGRQVDGGWFGWIDREGHAHRLADPLAIEREVVAIVRELADLRGALTGRNEPAALYAAVDAGRASWARLQILEGDLERFKHEATARDDIAWTAYAADWRSKRKIP